MKAQRLLLRPADRRQLAQLTAAALPEECCGILVGRRRRGAETLVTRLVPAANVSDERERHFEIDPGDVLRAHKEAGADEAVVGFYHSHPEGRCHPSNQDREQAWPGASYLIATPDGGLSSWYCAAAGSLEREMVIAGRERDESK